MKSGDVFGQYRILDPLGAGGMGEVYRARDETLRRDVAVKVLPESMKNDPERIARMRREAHSLAALSHPNVAVIHGLEEADGALFLVLELVEGTTLQERLDGGPMAVDEALRIAAQIAGGLEAAHERGIIHRDLKPANVKVTPDDRVKVLDFGLAKSAQEATGREGDADPSSSPTITVAATRTGVVMGTAAYMSPEQARGQPLDRRTDIWSFGCVLFEMLSGRRAFDRETISDTLAAILEHEPDWNALPAGTPAAVEHLLRKCVRKDSGRRLRDIGDARIELEDSLAGGPPVAPPDTHSPDGPRLRVGGAIWAIAGAAAMAIGLLGWQLLGPDRAPTASTALDITAPAGARITIGAAESTIAVSPDGSLVAFTSGLVLDGTSQIYLRAVDELDARPVPGTEAGSSPFFSPDGRWLGFASEGALMKVPVSGGTAVPIASVQQLRGASWSEDGTIVFAANDLDGGLYRVADDGGEPVPVTTPDTADGEQFHRWPHVLPGGRAVVFSIYTGLKESRRRIGLASLEDGSHRTLWTGGTYPRYVASGHVLYTRHGTLYAVPFDAGRLEEAGEPVPLLQDVGYHLGSGYAAFAVAGETGTLVYVHRVTRFRQAELVRIDREGAVERLTSRPQTFSVRAYPAASPQEGRIAATVRAGMEDGEVGIHDIGRDTWTALAPAGGVDGATAWSPDGEWIYFEPPEPPVPKIARIRADGTGDVEILTDGSSFDWVSDLSDDGRLMAFMRATRGGDWDLMLMDLAGPSAPQPFQSTPAIEAWPTFSPDGRYIAYESWEDGREVYVAPYPGPGPRTKVSSAGGETPVWHPDGTELFYRSGRSIWAVPVETRPEFRLTGPATELFEKEFLAAAWSNRFAVSADGQSFLLFARVAATTPTEPLRLLYVDGWLDSLER